MVGTGDLIISLTGTLGKRDYGFAVTIDIQGEYLLNQRVAKITPKKNITSNRYLSYLMKSEPYLVQIYALPSGTKQANLSNDNVLSAICGIPPLREQKQIADYLEKKTAQIDTLVDKAKQSIELLKEKRVAIISAAVTGKIDVRGVV